MNDENIVNNLPIFERNIEKFINPTEHAWEKRYYYSLFDIPMDCDDYQNKIQLISNNYIQTILWTLNYYHDDCINWRIAYEYEYPPLLTDLHKHIPYFNNEITLQREMNPYHSLCSLVYIIPQVVMIYFHQKSRIYS